MVLWPLTGLEVLGGIFSRGDFVTKIQWSTLHNTLSQKKNQNFHHGDCKYSPEIPQSYTRCPLLRGFGERCPLLRDFGDSGGCHKVIVFHTFIQYVGCGRINFSTKNLKIKNNSFNGKEGWKDMYFSSLTREAPDGLIYF